MEEVEISTEHAQEAIHDHAEHSGEKWLLYSALISSFLAVAAAVCGLHASHSANKAMIAQMHASDQWGYYQSKGVKANITEMHSDMLESNHQPVPKELKDKLERYKKEQQDIKEIATEDEKKSEYFMDKYETLAASVTAFQIAITVTAMSAITKRKHFLFFTLFLALAGVYYMAVAFLG